MADEPVPPLQAIYLYATATCNQRCRHCWVDAGSGARASGAASRQVSPAGRGGALAGPPLTPTELCRLLSPARALGLSWVKITGGEPFLRPDLVDLIAVLREQALEVEIETNGTLIDDAVADRLAALEPRQIAVSLDGADAATHDRLRGERGAFDRTVAAIRRLVDRDLSVQVLFTLTRDNVDQIDAVVTRCHDLGVGSFKMNFLAPLGRGVELHRQGLALPAGQVIEAARALEARAPSSAVELTTALPLAFVSRERLRAGSGHRCPIRNILGLLADGRVALCGVGYLAPELVLGDLRDTPIHDLWQSSPVLHQVRDRLHARLEGVCGRCLMRGACLGACRAAAFVGGGGLYGSFWLCQEAEREGLFPLARLTPAE